MNKLPAFPDHEPPFNYRHLHYFWVVAKEGGMSGAAERLDMAVQTVSAQVRELERARLRTAAARSGAASR